MGAIRPGAPPSLQLTSPGGQGGHLGPSLRARVSDWRRAHLVLRTGGSSHAGPRSRPRSEWGWGEAWAELGLRTRVPVEAQQRGSRLLGLSSAGTAGITPKPRSHGRGGGAAGPPGRFEDGARPGRHQPSPSPAPDPTPRRLPEPPLRAAHSARPLPAPGPPPMGCSHCAASPSAASSQPKMAAAAATELLVAFLKARDPSARKPRPAPPDLFFSLVKTNAINELF